MVIYQFYIYIVQTIVIMSSDHFLVQLIQKEQQLGRGDQNC